MSVGAICFTSSGSNGDCLVVLVLPPLFLAKRVFFPIRDLRLEKKVVTIYNPPSSKKKSIEKNASCAQKKSELRYFPQSSYTFLHEGGQVPS